MALRLLRLGPASASARGVAAAAQRSGGIHTQVQDQRQYGPLAYILGEVLKGARGRDGAIGGTGAWGLSVGGAGLVAGGLGQESRRTRLRPHLCAVLQLRQTQK
uniref:NADH:ubiquinone oxidoreductase subunit A10 n=1 Tax=Molossus molossus TaxID=27622 RepID=A0A7J8FSH5_MOLMO|nr:NADH:ubiquinone oxidoreductase subunit A10 [Molossus molossus]